MLGLYVKYNKKNVRNRQDNYMRKKYKTEPTILNLCQPLAHIGVPHRAFVLNRLENTVKAIIAPRNRAKKFIDPKCAGPFRAEEA
jgi:hypothetical protein